MLKLVAFVLPLAVDSFAIAALIGAIGVTRAQRWRISLLFMVFEGVMPLIGLGLGAPLARIIGSTADYVAAAALVGLGVWMLISGGSPDTDRPHYHRDRSPPVPSVLSRFSRRGVSVTG